MKLLKRAVTENVEAVVATKTEVAYLSNGVLVFTNDTKVEAPPQSYVTVEPGDNFRIYAQSNSMLFRLSEDKFEPVCEDKCEAFVVVDKDRFIRINPEGKEGTDCLYDKGTLVWSFPEEKGLPIYRDNTLVTFPDFKHKTLHFRDMDTFQIKNEISATEPFEFIRNSHHTFEDRVMFFQRQSKGDTAKIQQVIATCCDLDTGEKRWETHLEGSHKYILNDVDGNLYALFGMHRPNGENLYLNCLNTSTGECTLEVVEKNTSVVSIPWLAQIYKGVMYISDFYTEGCVIWAFDLTTRKVVSHINLGLKKYIQLRAPVIRNDEIYVLDSTQTLHVLEIKH
jgi:outer membrane protein assembly factor BamB